MLYAGSGMVGFRRETTKRFIMTETTTLAFFVTTSLLLIVAPGPDIVFLISQGATRGPKAGGTTAMGLACGNLVHTLGAALGISVIFRTSALAFQALKFAGVAYLLFLAVRTARSGDAPSEATDESHPKGNTLFRRGLLMNILNPKVALFFLAFLPQFASAESGPVWMQMAFYGIFFTLLVVMVFGAIGLFAGHLSRWLGSGGRFGRYAKWAVATVYASLAARLVFVRQ
jgi:threonine/homoserine/homoserine lactone efflux protein